MSAPAKWPGRPLVVKISWPTSGQISEIDFLKKVRGEHAWAAKHLPHVVLRRRRGLQRGFDSGVCCGSVRGSQGRERKVRVRTADAPDHTGAIVSAEVAGEREGHWAGAPGRCVRYVRPPPTGLR